MKDEIIKEKPPYESLSELIDRDFRKVESINENPFPVDAFPELVRKIIYETNDKLKFPIEYIGSSLLYAVSVAIGNTHVIEIQKGYRQNAVVFIAIVGNSGTNKSAPLTFALKPIHDRGIETHAEYIKAKQEYDINEKLDKNEREELDKPFWKQHILSDFTIESLNEVHQYNPRGIGAYADELASWINNFNRYNKGSEEQYWLSAWNGNVITINRKSGEPILIPNPFISVCGTTQPKTLKELFKGKVDNGFLYRVLTVISQDLKKEYWSENEIDDTYKNNWKVVINRVLDLPLNRDTANKIDPVVLKLSPEAKIKLSDWQIEITDKSNESDEEIEKGIYAKLEMYASRLSLIIEILNHACDGTQPKEISIESVKGSLKLCDYFFKSALLVNEIVLNENPLVHLPMNKQNLYNSLSEYFTTGEGLKLAEGFTMKESTFKKWLRKKDLFEKQKQGHYRKLIKG